MSGQINTRRASVEKLSVEGNTQDQIADVLGISQRTVARDMDEIHRANILKLTEDSIADDITRVLSRADRVAGGLFLRSNWNDDLLIRKLMPVVEQLPLPSPK
jgi:DNA-binding CsgD family transcriptional regulator